jgi:hypothetical protein
MRGKQVSRFVSIVFDIGAGVRRAGRKGGKPRQVGAMGKVGAPRTQVPSEYNGHH